MERDLNNKLQALFAEYVAKVKAHLCGKISKGYSLWLICPRRLYAGIGHWYYDSCQWRPWWGPCGNWCFGFHDIRFRLGAQRLCGIFRTKQALFRLLAQSASVLSKCEPGRDCVVWIHLYPRVILDCVEYFSADFAHDVKSAVFCFKWIPYLLYTIFLRRSSCFFYAFCVILSTVKKV